MAEEKIERARFNMIEQQIRPWDVLGAQVLETMRSVPREQFVTDAYRGLAFADIEIPIGHGERMMAPRVEARMLQALAIQTDDKMLEIGTGCGFVSACLARLGGRLTSVDIHSDFIEQARERLEAMRIRNAELFVRDGLDGPLPNTPFDVIAATGSVPLRDTAEGLQQQLTLGGRMFLVVGEPPVMEALLITRTGSTSFREESLFETLLPPLANAPAPAHFHF